MKTIPEDAIIWPADHNMTEEVEEAARKNPITGKQWNEMVERIEKLEQQVKASEAKDAIYGAKG